MAARKKKTKKKVAKKKRPPGSGKRGPVKGTGGREQKPLDWNQIEAMCKIQCTQTEIAAVTNTSATTLNVRCKKENGKTFSEYLKEKAEDGKASLRRAMWKKALENGGDRVMLIWVSKNVLGWADKKEVTDGDTIKREVVTLRFVNQPEQEKDDGQGQQTAPAASAA